MLSMLLTAALATVDPAPAGHVLAWADEFEADGLPDASKWTYDTHANRTGWYNEEAQYYAAARPENARIEDGVLIIEARRETMDPAPADWGGQAYTSARMVSTAAWDEGFIEARAKLPCGRGTWPAIWMLPRDASDWPAGGEIDIMEHVGHDRGEIHGTVHTSRYNHTQGTQRGGMKRVRDACDAFHRYQVLWTPEGINFGVDDVGYYRFRNDGRGDRDTWPFDAPFYLILNIAIGGDWGGAEGVDDRAFPQRMEIDYVRVFRRDG